ncbi:hypothetical protein KGP36_02945 [Patescibacteria group bacterium]|nr:hypothetical protein [Patescibacteria group bacterium]
MADTQDGYVPAGGSQPSSQDGYVPAASTPSTPPQRSWLDREQDDYAKAAQEGFAGNLVQNAMYYTGYMKPKGMSDGDWWKALSAARKADIDHYNQLDQQDPGSGWTNTAAQVLGGLGGVNPVWAFGGVASKGMSPLAAAASRIASVGAANVGSSLANQAENNNAGVQQGYDIPQALIEGGLAGGLHALGEAGSAALSYFKKPAADAVEDITVAQKKAAIQQMVNDGASFDDIMKAYPDTDPTVNWYVQQKAMGNATPPINWSRGLSEGDKIVTQKTPSDVGTPGHDVELQDSDGNVKATGRVYLDENGKPGQVVLQHPETGAPHPISRNEGNILRNEVKKIQDANPQDGYAPVPQEETTTAEVPQKDDGKFTTTERPSVDDNGLNQPNHTFKYTAPNGQTVKGSYDVEDGALHSIDIGDKENKASIGAAASRQLLQKIVEAHPEVETVVAHRISGANPGREIVFDADRLRNDLHPEDAPDMRPHAPQYQQPADTSISDNSPSVTTEIPRTTTINKDRIFGSDELKEGLDRVAASMSKDVEPQTFDKQKEDAWNLLQNHSEDDLLNMKVNEDNGHALQLATRTISRQAVQRAVNLADNTKDLGESAPQSVRDAVSQAWDFAKKALNRDEEIANFSGSLLGGRRIISGPASDLNPSQKATILKGLKDDPETLEKFIKMSKEIEPNELLDLFRNNILSNPFTHAYYYTGMMSNLLADIASEGGASLLGQARRFSNMPDATNRVYATQVAARVAGMIHGLGSALKDAYPENGLKNAAMSFLRNEEGASLQQGVGIPTAVLHNVEGFMGKIVQSSALWGEAAKAMKDSSVPLKDMPQFMKDFMANPSTEVLKRVANSTDRILFKDAPSDITKWINSRSFTMKDGATKTALDFMIPFTTRPDSILRTAIRYSPLGVMDRYNIAGLKAGGAEADKALSRIALGTSIIGTAVPLALSGKITGDGPSDYRKRQELMDTGWQPNSIKIGDTYYKYKGLSPFADVITAAANAVDAYKEHGRPDLYSQDMAGIIAKTAGRAAVDGSWIKDFSPVLAAADDTYQGERTVKNAIANLASSVAVPAGVRAVNQSVIDKTARDTRGDTLGEMITNRIKAGIPGMSQSLPAKEDNYGRTMQNFTGFPSTSQDRNDPVANEIAALSEGDMKGVIGPDPKSFSYGDGQKYTMTKEEAAQFKSMTHSYLHEALGDLINQPAWQYLDDDTKRQYARERVKEVRSYVKKSMFGGN